MDKIGGQLFDIFTTEEINSWVSTMKKLPPLTIKDNICQATDEKNIFNYWFQKTIFDRIKQIFGKDLNLVFGMLLDEKKPWGIHHDAYHLKDYSDRTPAISFLIPYSVDHQTDLISNAHTIVFNEKTTTGIEINSTNIPAISIYETHLSHNEVELVKPLSIQGIYRWAPNSIIYWNSYYLHDTDNFLANGFTSKQAIVIHTYYQN